MKNKLRKVSAKICLIATFCLGFLAMAPVLALADNLPSNNSGGNYTIQLKSAEDFGSLLFVATNIRHLTFSNKNPQFNNIYSFYSSDNQDTISTVLKSKYNYLEPQKKLQTAGVMVNDPGFTTNPQDTDKEWGLVKAGFDQAWQKTTGSQNNVVAVIDTGIDETHEDLKSINFLSGFNFISQQPILPGSNADDNGHGTLVAGYWALRPTTASAWWEPIGKFP